MYDLIPILHDEKLINESNPWFLIANN